MGMALFFVAFFTILTICPVVLLFKLRLIPVSRSVLLEYKKTPWPLVLLTSTLSSLALVSGCTAGGLIGTLLSGEPKKQLYSQY